MKVSSLSGEYRSDADVQVSLRNLGEFQNVYQKDVEGKVSGSLISSDVYMLTCSAAFHCDFL